MRAFPPGARKFVQSLTHGEMRRTCANGEAPPANSLPQTS